MADEPFCPAEKNSSASSTSVRCKCRISMASRSIDDATTPSVAKNIACRSRGITCVDTGSGHQAHLRRDILFDPRIDIREGADRARYGAGRHVLPRRQQVASFARENSA